MDGQQVGDAAESSAVSRARARLLGAPRSAADWGSYACLAGGAGMIAFMAYLVSSYDSTLPWVDQWIFLRDLMGNHGHCRVSLLWR